ncbi:MAG: hypothetical protein EOO73_30375 [Myxococcales bacterium]|nr:MAG: hypothetical protein EOO73_30375 [Myxococcales bacterium]
MSLQSLARALIRDTATLVAAVATHSGARMPLGPLADRFFHGVATELHGKQIRRRVAADMFGLVPRAYLRKVRRAEESVTEHGYSLWQAVYEHIAQSANGVEIAALTRRFHRDDEGVLRGVLSDLRESGLVDVVTRAGDSRYVASSGAELGARVAERRAPSDELVWAVIYREGPLYREALQQVVGLPDAELTDALTRLKEAGRIYERPKRDRLLLGSTSTVPDLEAPERWEAVVFEHYHAVVRALATSLAAPTAENNATATVTFNVWPGHPMAMEAEKLFHRLRTEATALAARIDAHNAGRAADSRARVMLYLGLCEDKPRVVESPSTLSPATFHDPDD